MRFFYINLLFLVFIILTSLPVLGFQSGGIKITGRVLEKGSGEPAAFATVALLRTDSTVVSGVNSDLEGNFELTGVRPGNYLLKVSSIGFRSQIVPKIAVHVESGDLELGVIYLDAEQNQLDEVTIVAEKSMITSDIDKTSVHIGQDLLASSNNATELLEKLPAVTIDENGSPMIRGKSNIVVLIDGKPSTQYGTDLASVLQSFPSDLIERIDVITTPSAKYEADGASGVIDIITKKATIVGKNGNVRLYAGNNNNYNGGFNFNYKAEKLSFRTTGNYNTQENYNDRKLERQNLLGSNPSTLFQDGTGFNKTSNGFGRVQANYDITPKLNLGAFVNFSSHDNRTEGAIDNRTVYSDLSEGRKFTRISDGKNDGTNITYGMDFRQEYSSKEHYLMASLSYTHAASDGRSDLSQESDEPQWRRQQYNLRDNHTNSLHGKIDFAWPVSDKFTFLAGGHTRQDSRENNNFLYTRNLETGEYVYDERISNIFGYQDALYSGYVSGTQKWKDWGVRIGLRLSKMDQHLNQISMDRKFSVHFLNFIPSLSVSRKVSETGMFRVNYTRRVQRPNAEWLNPYTDITDPRNIRTGNPDLNPEFTHRLDLGYSNYKNVFGIGTNLFSSYSNNAITNIRTIDEDGVSYSRFDNVGREMSYGFETDISYKVSEKLKFNSSGRVFRSEIVSRAANIDSRRWSFSGNLNAFFHLPVGFRGSFYISYEGPTAVAQGYRLGVTQANLSLRRNFMKNKAFIALNVNDIFLSRRYVNNLKTDTYIQHSVWHRTNRNIGVTMHYRFGKISAQNR